MRLIADASASFEKNCVRGIEANRERISKLLHEVYRSSSHYFSGLKSIHQYEIMIYFSGSVVSYACDIIESGKIMIMSGDIMIMSGDKIFIKKLSSLRTSGYTNLAVFRPNTCHQDDINEEVQDSWVWRQLLCLPSEAGKRVGNKFDLDLEPSMRKQRISLSASYYQVSDSVGNKFRALVAFLKKQPGKKISIFFSSCESVKHYSGLLRALGMPFSVCEIHGKQSIGINLKVFSEFKEQKGAHILLCSDSIALCHHVLPVVVSTLVCP